MWYIYKKNPLCCGTLLFGRFKKEKPFNDWSYWGDGNSIPWKQLTGKELDKFAYGQAEFTDDPLVLKENQEAFKEMCEKYKLVCVTEPRINKEHTATKKNKIFVAIFQARAKTKTTTTGL